MDCFVRLSGDNRQVDEDLNLPPMSVPPEAVTAMAAIRRRFFVLDFRWGRTEPSLWLSALVPLLPLRLPCCDGQICGVLLPVGFIQRIRAHRPEPPFAGISAIGVNDYKGDFPQSAGGISQPASMCQD